MAAMELTHLHSLQRPRLPCNFYGVQVSMALQAPSSVHPTSTVDDAIGVVPLLRWDVETPDAMLTMPLRARFGGFLKAVEHFDGGAFQISSAEALLMDPQQRLLLQVNPNSETLFKGYCSQEPPAPPGRQEAALACAGVLCVQQSIRQTEVAGGLTQHVQHMLPRLVHH
jgi:Beta-ketoacyl synthase, N-terminal domain